MRQEDCKFHSHSDADWTGLEHDVDFGVLGTGIWQAAVDEDKKILEINLIPPDTALHHTWRIPIEYCPVCGKKL